MTESIDFLDLVEASATPGSELNLEAVGEYRNALDLVNTYAPYNVMRLMHLTHLTREGCYSIGTPSRSTANRSPAGMGTRSRFSMGGIGQFHARLNEQGKSVA